VNGLVIYDSYFGNTEQVAQAIGQVLGSAGEIQSLRVGMLQPEQLKGLKLLVVGSPTRGFRPTEAISDLLKGLPKNHLSGTKVAAFDTRFTEEEIKSSAKFLPFMVKIFGYAAKPIADRLQEKGGELVEPPEGFYVRGTEGPLLEGELSRAAEWAQRILTHL
jgi:flavodoxin